MTKFFTRGTNQLDEESNAMRGRVGGEALWGESATKEPNEKQGKGTMISGKPTKHLENNCCDKQGTVSGGFT